MLAGQDGYVYAVRECRGVRFEPPGTCWKYLCPVDAEVGLGG